MDFEWIILGIVTLVNFGFAWTCKNFAENARDAARLAIDQIDRADQLSERSPQTKEG